MKSPIQGAGARFVRNVVMGVLLSLVPLSGPAVASERLSLLPLVVTCPLGAVSTRFTPGLRNTAQRDVSVRTESAYDGCLTLLGDPVSSAQAVEEQSLAYPSCGAVRTGVTTRTTLKWDTGDSSTLSLALYAVDVQGLLTIETYNGTVVEGKYQGAQAVRTITYVNTDFTGGCLSVHGLTEAQGISNLVLTLL